MKRRIHLILGAATAFAALCVAFSAQAQAPDPLSGLSGAIESMRDGRFSEAGESFSRLASGDPQDPVSPLLEGMSLWWRTLTGGGSVTPELVEGRFAEAARRARAMAAAGDTEARSRALTFLGISLMFEARSRAARGAAFSAGSPAREGHRALSEALKLSPDNPDALFAMGAYNYYADNVGVLVKGLRALLLIPGGDEELGIRQLERAGDRSLLFGTESLLLLSHIFSGAFEEDFRRADGYLLRATRRHERSPLLALLRADLLYRLGRLSEAETLARHAGELAQGPSDAQVRMTLEAAYRRAASLLAQRRAEESLEVIEAALTGLPPVEPEARQRWSVLIAATARETGEIDRARAALSALGTGVSAPSIGADGVTPRRRRSGESSPTSNARRAAALRLDAAGRRSEALEELARLSSDQPADARVAYDMGRLLQRDGRSIEARRHLELAARSELAEVAGWALLRLGWDREIHGSRAEALPYYRKAGELKRFAFKDAAKDRVRYPTSIEPES